MWSRTFFKRLIQEEISKRNAEAGRRNFSLRRSLSRSFSNVRSEPVSTSASAVNALVASAKSAEGLGAPFARRPFQRLNSDMIRRADHELKPINPSGILCEKSGRDEKIMDDAERKCVYVKWF